MKKVIENAIIEIEVLRLVLKCWKDEGVDIDFKSANKRINAALCHLKKAIDLCDGVKKRERKK